MAIDDSEQKRDALIEQLHAFGKNFKQNARIDHSAISAIKPKLGGRLNEFKPSMSLSSSVQKTNQPLDPRQSVLTTQSYLRNVGIDYMDYNDYTNTSVKNLAQKLGNLYNVSILSCLNHVSSNANKSQQIGISK